MDLAKEKRKCSMCKQYITDDILYKRDLLKPVSELAALKKDIFCLHKDHGVVEDKEVPSFKVTSFTIYDRYNHMCPIDSGLIDKGVALYFSGFLKTVDDDNPSVENGVSVSKVGPIKEWWIYGYDGTDRTIIGLTTDLAFYYLMHPSQQYAKIFKYLPERTKLSKRVIEFLLDFGWQNPSFEDLIDHLKGFEEFTEVEELLLREAQFLCDQVISYDEETVGDEVPMISYSCIKTLIELTGINIKREKMQKYTKNDESKQNSISPNITTTNLVRDVFQRFLFEQAGNLCENKIKIEGEAKELKSQTDSEKRSEEIRDMVDEHPENQSFRYQDYQDLESSTNSQDEEVNKPGKHKECSKQILHTVKWLKKNTMQYNDCQNYSSACVENFEVYQGDYVMLQAEDSDEPLRIAVVCYMFDSPSEGALFHAHFFCRGTDTILGNTANPRELFVVDDCDNYPLGCIVKKAEVEFCKCPDNWKDLGGQTDGLPIELDDNGRSYFFSKIYDYEFSKFRDYIEYKQGYTTLDSNQPCLSCRWQTEIENYETPIFKENSILWRKEAFNIGSAVFLEPGQMKNIPESVKEDDRYNIDSALYPEMYRKKADVIRGSNLDTPEPFTVGLIEDIKGQKNDIKIKVRLFYRPEDTQGSLFLSYVADINYLYWTNDVIWTTFKNVAGKCYVTFSDDIELARKWSAKGPFRFYYSMAYNHKSFQIFKVPLEGRLFSSELKEKPQKKYKLRSIEQSDDNSLENVPKWEQKIETPLRCMDIYAGCGGLSAGLHQAGVANTLWAIEKEVPPAQAFQVNNPECHVFTEDCNNILKAVLSGGSQTNGLPDKGDVELLIGGPPCQGFSGMNRFSTGRYSYFNNSQIITFLGYCDYYRPKYIVLENVRNFVSFKKGTIFKLTLKSLLTIGYQVSFGILQAGQFGIPQTRRRFILMGAAPGCVLPSLPEPLHVFSKSSTSLSIVIDGLRYDTGSQWSESLPYRTICVRDAIGDLPEIENGCDTTEMPYEEVKSNFQRQARKPHKSGVVKDHICKKLSPLVEARISCIPADPGADWRDLPNKVVQLKDGSSTNVLLYRYRKKDQNKIEAPHGICKCAIGSTCDPADRQFNTLIPWCLAHTADRHNHWVAVYGRLEWDGYFGTTVTNPEPMGTQGRVLHPEQNRVVSVRECARSQGFQDEYKFCGNILDKHRQVGNAVPPPLALSLGREILKAHNASAREY